MFLEGLTDYDKSGNHQDGSEVICWEASFRFEKAFVFCYVPVCEVVVEEMAEELTEGDSYDWGEVKEGDGFGTESVAAFSNGSGEENRRCDINADGPHE